MRVGAAAAFVVLEAAANELAGGADSVFANELLSVGPELAAAEVFFTSVLLAAAVLPGTFFDVAAAG